MQPLLALGPHVFEIAPLNYQRFERRSEVLFPTVPRFGQRPNRQHTGYGEDPVRIEGLLYPDEFGGRAEFDALRATQEAARAVLLMGWAGPTSARLFGRVVILSIDDRQSSINAAGQGRKLAFDIALAPAPRAGSRWKLF